MVITLAFTSLSAVGCRYLLLGAVYDCDKKMRDFSKRTGTLIGLGVGFFVGLGGDILIATQPKEPAAIVQPAAFTTGTAFE